MYDAHPSPKKPIAAELGKITIALLNQARLTTVSTDFKSLHTDF